MLEHEVKIEIEKSVYILLSISNECMVYSCNDYMQEYDPHDEKFKLKMYRKYDNGKVTYKNEKYYEMFSLDYRPVISKLYHCHFAQYLFIFNNNVVYVNYNRNDFSYRIETFEKNEFSVEENLRQLFNNFKHTPFI